MTDTSGPGSVEEAREAVMQTMLLGYGPDSDYRPDSKEYGRSLTNARAENDKEIDAMIAAVRSSERARLATPPATPERVVTESDVARIWASVHGPALKAGYTWSDVRDPTMELVRQVAALRGPTP